MTCTSTVYRDRIRVTCTRTLRTCIVITGQELQDIRLVQGASGGVRDGRIEVQYQGLWGTICQDGFDNQDAGVVCRMLGYEYAQKPLHWRFLSVTVD